jgi:tetratricopeptide (TPR) repeat protein
MYTLAIKIRPRTPLQQTGTTHPSAYPIYSRTLNSIERAILKPSNQGRSLLKRFYEPVHPSLLTRESSNHLITKIEDEMLSDRLSRPHHELKAEAIGDVYVLTGDYTKAIKKFHSATEHYADGFLQLELGNAYMARGAVREYEVAMGKKHVWGLFHEDFKGDYEKAINTYKAAVEGVHVTRVPHAYQARAYMALRKYEKAFQEYHEVLDHASSLTLWKELGDMQDFAIDGSVPSEEKGNESAVNGSGYFRVPLEEVIRRERELESSSHVDSIPRIVRQCLNAITPHTAMSTASVLYRKTGGVESIAKLRYQYDTGTSPLTQQLTSLGTYPEKIGSEDTACPLLLHYLRLLPDPLLTRKLSAEFLQATGADPCFAADLVISDLQERLEKIKTLIEKLPRSNSNLVSALAHHLHEYVSRMNQLMIELHIDRIMGRWISCSFRSYFDQYFSNLVCPMLGMNKSR